MQLSVSGQHAPDRSIVLVLRGEIDYASAADLRHAITTAALHDPRPPTTELDLTGVTGVDHLGAGTLVVGDRICRQLGIHLVLRHPSPPILSLLRLSSRRGSGDTISRPRLFPINRRNSGAGEPAPFHGATVRMLPGASVSGYASSSRAAADAASV